MTFSWILAGIHDALTKVKDPPLPIRQARARAIVGLAAAEQLSIDNGSWLMAQEVLLEKEPPIQSFDLHASKTLTTSPFSELIDARHQVVHLARLRALDEMTERERRLTKGGGKGKAKEDRPDGAADGAQGGESNDDAKRKGRRGDR